MATAPTRAGWAGHPAVRVLDRARALLADAAAADSADERFRLAHLAALRAAAAVLTDRGRPPAARRRLVSAWVLVEAVAPEYGRWAARFARSAGDRVAIEAGATGVVDAAGADDEYRAAAQFLAAVAGDIGVLHPPLAS